MVEVLDGQPPGFHLLAVVIQAFIGRAAVVGQRGGGERLRPQSQPQVGRAVDHALGEIVAGAHVAGQAAEGILAGGGLVAGGVQQRRGQGILFMHLRQGDKFGLRCQRGALVAHAVQRDVFGGQVDGMLDRGLHAAQGLPGKAVHHVNVEALEAGLADVLGGPLVIAERGSGAPNGLQQARADGLHAHADAPDAHPIQRLDLFWLEGGDLGRGLDADGYLLRQVEAAPRRLHQAGQVGRFGRRGRAAADIEAHQGFAGCIYCLAVQLELAQQQVEVQVFVGGQGGRVHHAVLAVAAAPLAEGDVGVQTQALHLLPSQGRQGLRLRIGHAVRPHGGQVADGVSGVGQVV